MKTVKPYELSEDMPIAVIDSGLGGLSTLKELTRVMPNENFIYYGDYNNAPYGVRSAENVRALTFECVNKMLEKPVKAVVIACNTATSAAAVFLRECYPFLPIIGAEPAIKPAYMSAPGVPILVLATQMTLSEEKFKKLCLSYSGESQIISCPCVGLVEFIERGITSSPELHNYLEGLLLPYKHIRPLTAVLGCTHYPFVKAEISSVLGEDVPLFDGNRGIANECQRRLAACDMLSKSGKRGTLSFEGNGMNGKKQKIIDVLFKQLGDQNDR